MPRQDERRPRVGPPPASPGTALFVLRVFLGVTFVYAGIQKLGDPGFLHPGAPTYIGTQLHAFAHNTPGGFLLRTFAIPQAKLAGIGVAFLEIAIGLLTTAGLLTRIAAAGGLALNLILFLTNSWHTYPYFLGSDIIFVFAWLPFVMTGASGQPALENSLDRVARSPRLRLDPSAPALTRRAVMQRALGAVGFATLALGGLAALTKGSYKGTRRLAATPVAKPPAQPQPAGHKPATAANVPSNAVKLGPSAQLTSGQSATYNDPSDGSPDLVIRGTDGKLVAFSAVCTHAGCTVGYQGGQLVCPCHGGTFSASDGSVISGPPPSGLSARKVMETGGVIYAIPS